MLPIWLTGHWTSNESFEGESPEHLLFFILSRKIALTWKNWMWAVVAVICSTWTSSCGSTVYPASEYSPLATASSRQCKFYSQRWVGLRLRWMKRWMGAGYKPNYFTRAIYTGGNYQAEFGLRAGDCFYTQLFWDRCKSRLARLWSRAKHGWDSTGHHLWSGTQLWSGSIAGKWHVRGDYDVKLLIQVCSREQM